MRWKNAIEVPPSIRRNGRAVSSNWMPGTNCGEVMLLGAPAPTMVLTAAL